MCLLIGMWYTTIYTSYFTKPGFEKLIQSVDDFVENGPGPVNLSPVKENLFYQILIFQTCFSVHLTPLQIRCLC